MRKKVIIATVVAAVGAIIATVSYLVCRHKAFVDDSDYWEDDESDDLEMEDKDIAAESVMI